MPAGKAGIIGELDRHVDRRGLGRRWDAWSEEKSGCSRNAYKQTAIHRELLDRELLEIAAEIRRVRRGLLPASR